MKLKKETRGRKSLEERFGINRIIKAYELHGTLRQTALALGVSHVALIDFFKRNGIERKSKREAMKYSHKDAGHTSEFAQWLEMNKGVALPRSISKLAKISHCNRNTITCYFYRRRSYIKKVLTSLPDLRNVNATLMDNFKNKYLTRSFTSYEYMIDKFSLKVRILATVGLDEKVLINIDDLKFFVKNIKALPILKTQVHLLHQQQESLSQQEKPSKGLHPEDTVKISEHIGTEDFLAPSEDTEL